MLGDAWLKCSSQVGTAWVNDEETAPRTARQDSEVQTRLDMEAKHQDRQKPWQQQTAFSDVLRYSQMFSDVLRCSQMFSAFHTFFNLLKGFCFSVLVWSWFFILLQGRPTRFGATSCGKGETFQRQNCAVDLLQAVGRVGPWIYRVCPKFWLP